MLNYQLMNKLVAIKNRKNSIRFRISGTIDNKIDNNMIYLHGTFSIDDLRTIAKCAEEIQIKPQLGKNFGPSRRYILREKKQKEEHMFIGSTVFFPENYHSPKIGNA